MNLIWKCVCVCVFLLYIKFIICKDGLGRCLGNVCCDVYFFRSNVSSNLFMVLIFYVLIFIIIYIFKGVYLIFSYVFGICCNYENSMFFLVLIE